MLLGEKVRLRALEESDAEVVQRWLNDVESITSSQAIPRLRSQKEFQASLRSRSPESQQMAVESLDGRLIGLAQLHGVDWVHRRAEVTVMVGEPDYRGRGFEEDALRLVTRFAVRVLHLHRLGAVTIGEDERLRKVYEAAGFEVEGRRERYYWNGSGYVDQIMYRYLAE